jgi:hypothetical protein
MVQMDEAKDVGEQPAQKMSTGVKALIAAAYVAGAASVGLPTAVIESNAGKAADDAVAGAVQRDVAPYVVAAHKETIPAMRDSTGKELVASKQVDVPERKQIAYDKFNPLIYYGKGDTIEVTALEKKSGKILYIGNITTDTSALFALKASMNPSNP